MPNILPHSSPTNLQTLPLEAPSDDTVTLLTVTFRIGDQHYGLPVSEVIEIVRLPALLTLAGAPRPIIGLLNLRGHYVPVLDGAILMDEPPRYDASNQIVIAGHSAGQRERGGEIVPFLGLRVDQVVDVQAFPSTRVTALDRSIVAPFLRGVINTGEDSVFLFNLASLHPMIRETMAEAAREQEQERPTTDMATAQGWEAI
jgi:purine-binding chemotaxis protein CheW